MVVCVYGIIVVSISFALFSLMLILFELAKKVLAYCKKNKVAQAPAVGKVEPVDLMNKTENLDSGLRLNKKPNAMKVELQVGVKVKISAKNQELNNSKSRSEVKKDPFGIKTMQFKVQKIRAEKSKNRRH